MDYLNNSNDLVKLRPIMKHKLDRILCNSNNHHEYSPFLVEKHCLIVDNKWWDELLSDTRNKIRKLIKTTIMLDTVKVPHNNFEEIESAYKEDSNSKINNKLYNIWWDIYYIYIHHRLSDVVPLC